MFRFSTRSTPNVIFSSSGDSRFHNIAPCFQSVLGVSTQVSTFVVQSVWAIAEVTPARASILARVKDCHHSFRPAKDVLAKKAATHSCSLQYLVLVISCGAPFSLFFKCSAHCWCAICHFWCSLAALGSQIPNYPEDPKDDKEKDIKACLPRTPRACAARWRGFLSCAQGFAGLPQSDPRPFE